MNKRQGNLLWKFSVLPLLMNDFRLAPKHEMWTLRSMVELLRVSENIDATMHQEEDPGLGNNPNFHMFGSLRLSQLREGFRIFHLTCLSSG